MSFEFHLPTKIIFGVGKVNSVGSEAAKLGSTVGIVSGRSSVANGNFEKVEDSLSKASLLVASHTLVPSDPTVLHVSNIISDIAKYKIDVLVALGGGSVMDASKAASVLFQVDNVSDYVGQTIGAHVNEIPVIAIPTTAGTGSEVTKGAIITDEVKKFKSGIRGIQLYPKIAIADPDLIQSMPKLVMQETLFDAFTHLLETLITKKSHSMIQAYSIRGLSTIADLLSRGDMDLNCKDSRESMLSAALMGGINVGMAGSCLPHRLQQAMGSISDVKCSHGRGLSSVYRAWSTEVQAHAKNRLALVYEIFGKKSFEEMLDGIQSTLEMPMKITDVGYQQEHIPQLCDAVSGAVENDPIPSPDRQLIEKIYYNAL